MLLQDLAYRTGCVMLRMLYRYEFSVSGHELATPALIASNHYGSLDPVLLMLGLRRKIAVFSGKRGHWGHPPAFIPDIGRIPLYPSQRIALRRAKAHLAHG